MGATTASRAGAQLQTLIDDVLAGHGQPLQQAETLPPAAYISDKFFELETQRIFMREWLCVGHVSQIPAVGDYFPLDLFDELFVIVRAPDRIRVMSRVCPHRWAPLVSQPGNAKFFSCPFHAWAFALDGQMLGAPLMDRVTFDVHSCRLPEYRTEILDGFIFVTFADDTPSLQEKLASFTDHVAKFRLDELVTGFVLDYDLAINWKIIVETFMECYHHIAAHVENFEKFYPARACTVEDGEKNWTVGHAPLRPNVPDDSGDAGFPLLANLTAEERREFRMYLIYPMHLLAIFPDRVGWFCLQPEGPKRTKLQTTLLVRPEARDDPEFDAKIAKERAYFIAFNDEDIAVNEKQMRGALSRTTRAGRLCDLEKAIWQLADYIRGKIAEPA
jgi:phenylpropionate dioxygenase-like ring-hydroxylating dioxygenase large terminal subunit